MKCLVVDDSATMRRIVVNALKTIGYANVVEAGDGQEALAKCDASIELVITDWNMPVMGGLDLVKNLRANPQTAKVPILMVILRAVGAGVNSCILKPFTPQVLKEKLDQISSAPSGSA